MFYNKLFKFFITFFCIGLVYFSQNSSARQQIPFGFFAHQCDPAASAIEATGGAITYAGGYTIHTFTTSGTFTVTSASNPCGSAVVEYLVVGGGGGGGGSWSSTNWTGGGGGGAGGYRNGALPVGVGAHPVVVGAGGAGGAIANNGVNGSDSYIQNPSSVDLVRSLGGGGGAGAVNPTQRNGLAGGSGGGGAGNLPPAIGGLGTAPQGRNGGGSGANRGSGAGGGAGGPGLNSGVPGTDAYGISYLKEHGGTGGPGLISSITGVSVQRGGGGGGGCDETANYLPGIGGLGGGGTGGTPTGTAGQPGAPETGGGGGGGTRAAGGAGGSGVVIIRYPTPTAIAYQSSAIDVNNLTTYTFASQPIGIPAFNRYVLVGVTARSLITGVIITSMTIGGISAPVVYQTDAGTTNTMAGFAVALVPSGTTGNVVVTFNTPMVYASIGVWTLRNLLSTTPQATTFFTDPNTGGTLNVPAGGVAVGVYGQNSGGGGALSWSAGLTSNYAFNSVSDAPNFRSATGGMMATPTAITPLTVTVGGGFINASVGAAISLK
jgi:hypothetical protein